MTCDKGTAGAYLLTGKAFSPEVIKLFTEAGMLRRAVTQIWNKEQSYRVGIVFEYKDRSLQGCQALLKALPAVEASPPRS